MDVDTVIVQCEHCKKTIRLKRSLLGKRAKCPGCQVLTRLSMESFEKGTDETVQLNAESTETAGSSKSSLDNGTSPSVKQSTSHPSTHPDGAAVAELTQKTIGRFRLESRVGRGGFGEVWKARDLNLDRTVAIKLPIFPPSDQRRARRFVTEAQAAARLGHPNIVAVYDAGVVKNQHYLAIEFIDGKSLDAVVAESPLSELDAAKLVMELAQALAYAHDESIIHRDIKPQNIVLNSERIPKIVDFGLAKLLEQESGQTVDGTVMGTPAYMAPEQARGDIQNIGPHTDQYSLGVVLYWILVQNVPFSGPHMAVISQVIRSEPPSLSSFKPDIDPRLEAICLKAMAKRPSDRYRNCSEFADDLKRFMEDKEVHAKPLSRIEKAIGWCRRNPLHSSLVIACVAIIAFGTSFSLFGYFRTVQLSRTAKQSQLAAVDEYKNQQSLEAEMRLQLEFATKEQERANASQTLAETKKSEIDEINRTLATTLATNRQLTTTILTKQVELDQNTQSQQELALKLKQLDSKEDQLKKQLEEAAAKAKVPEDPLVLLESGLKKIGDLINAQNWSQARIELDNASVHQSNSRWRLLSRVVDLRSTELPSKIYKLPSKNSACRFDKNDNAIVIKYGHNLMRSNLTVIDGMTFDNLFALTEIGGMNKDHIFILDNRSFGRWANEFSRSRLAMFSDHGEVYASNRFERFLTIYGEIPSIAFFVEQTTTGRLFAATDGRTIRIFNGRVSDQPAKLPLVLLELIGSTWTPVWQVNQDPNYPPEFPKVFYGLKLDVDDPSLIALLDLGGQKYIAFRNNAAVGAIVADYYRTGLPPSLQAKVRDPKADATKFVRIQDEWKLTESGVNLSFADFILKWQKSEDPSRSSWYGNENQLIVRYEDRLAVCELGSAAPTTDDRKTQQ